MKFTNILFFCLPLGMSLPAAAHSVALSEDFNSDYSVNFPTLLELDHQAPLDNFRPIFTDGSGVARPWWKVKDSNASPESFIASHSAYNPAGTSNDWLVSRAVEIPTAGYMLTFDAQSLVMRVAGDRVSDLWVFITDYAPEEGRLPSEPAMHIERVPEGDYPYDLENDFTSYSLNLDGYAGKTIYISFANLNTDKDILVVDNVLVQRLDNADLTAVSERYVEKGDFSVDVTASATAGVPVRDWTLSFTPYPGAETQTVSGAELKPGETVSHSFVSSVEADQTADWKVTFTADGIQEIVGKGTVTGLEFVPYHKVLLEESTGLWCSNCPLGMYAMENMVHDPEMKDYVIPVSVHISGSAPDYMVENEYARMFAVNIAPALRIDRSSVVNTFSIEHDGGVFDKDNSRSIAYQVRRRHEEIALMGIELKGELLTQGADTTSVRCDVTLRPAVTLPGKKYAVGFALVENNVGIDGSRYWRQENGFSGAELESGLGGFTTLPKRLEDWRYMDVARGAFDFHGHQSIVLPETMEMGKELSYTVEIPIPDTYQEIESGGTKTMVSPAIVAANLSLVAFILDVENGFTAVNSDVYPLTEQAARRLTIAELAERSGVDEITDGAAFGGEPEYFTLQGVKVSNPGAGIYIVRRGSKVSKEIVR